MSSRTAIVLAVLAALLLAAAPCFADGMVIIRRPPPSPRPIIPLAVKYHHVTVKIEDPIAVTSVDQVFVNPNPLDLEGEYIFPLPEGSVVTEFNMYMNGKEVGGEIVEADKAREIYESIVRQMKDPALLEYVGTRMFKARVYPVPANGETRITLKYSEMLVLDLGLRTYRYPLNTEKFSSAPLQSVVVGVEISTSQPLMNVHSPSHAVEVTRTGDKQAKASFEAKNVKPDQDFILYYSTSTDDFGLSVATFEKPGEDGFFLIMVAPGIDIERVIPKDVIFVIDTSLSMSEAQGGAIEGAKKTLRYCLGALRPSDRFNVVDFSMEVRSFADKLVDASKDNVEAGMAYVDRLKARGATAIDEALRTALDMGGSDTDRPYMIVFITDGAPTWGERDTNKIRQNVMDKNNRKARIFAFGIGDEIDTLFLDRLAKDNRGTREFVTGKEDLELKVTRFFDKVSNPVLSDAVLKVDGLRVSEVYPNPLPDIFKGDQLAILGRYQGEGARAVTLSGKVQGKEIRYVYEARFNGKSGGGEFIPRFWASLRIANLLEEIRLRGENAEIKSEIIRLSKKYGIMNNRYVSFLVVEDKPTAAPAPGRDAWVERAREERAGAPSGGGRPSDDLGSSGAEAGRRFAESLDKSKAGFRAGDEGEAQGKASSKMVKYVGEKTFYMDKGVWVDSAYDGKSPATEVKFMSDEYFELSKKSADLRKSLALGEEVLVVHEGKAYRIVK